MVERKEIVERAERTVLRMLREGDQHAADAILKLLEELVEETEAADNWRRLALQFDNHRMQALGHLKAVVNPGTVFDAYKAAKAFLNAPPLDGEEVLAQRLAELATTPAADAGNPVSASATVSDEQIKAVFLANGFTIKEGLTDLKPYVYQAAHALLATVGAGGAEPPRKPVEDGWLQDGPLLYRLTDARRPRNRDEIIVTMANSSRTEEARTRRAGELLNAVRAIAPQTNQTDALDAARYRFLRDTYWSSDKELATVISLQMNKVWDERIDEAMARNKKE